MFSWHGGGLETSPHGLLGAGVPGRRDDAAYAPSSMAETVTTVSTEMGGCACPYPPCTGHMPNCLDHGGCISVSVLPTSPATIALPVEWRSLDYHLPPQLLAGISVKPELFPPILAT